MHSNTSTNLPNGIISERVYSSQGKILIQQMAKKCFKAIKSVHTQPTNDGETIIKQLLVKKIRQTEIAVFLAGKALCYTGVRKELIHEYNFPTEFYQQLATQFKGELEKTSLDATLKPTLETVLDTAYQAELVQTPLQNYLLLIIQNNLLNYLRHLAINWVVEHSKLIKQKENDSSSVYLKSITELSNYNNLLAIISTAAQTFQQNDGSTNPKIDSLTKKINCVISIVYQTEFDKNSNIINSNSTGIEKRDSLADLFIQLDKPENRELLSKSRSRTGNWITLVDGEQLLNHLDNLRQQFIKLHNYGLNTAISEALPDVKQNKMQKRAPITMHDAKTLVKKAFISPLLYRSGMLLGREKGTKAIQAMTSECLFKIEKQGGYRLSDEHRDTLVLALTELFNRTELPDLYYATHSYNSVSNGNTQEKDFTLHAERAIFLETFANIYISILNTNKQSSTSITLRTISNSIEEAYKKSVSLVTRIHINKIIRSNLQRYLRHLCLTLVDQANSAFSSMAISDYVYSGEKKQLDKKELNRIRRLIINIKDYTTIEEADFMQTIQAIFTKNESLNDSSDTQLTEIQQKIKTTQQLLVQNPIPSQEKKPLPSSSASIVKLVVRLSIIHDDTGNNTRDSITERRNTTFKLLTSFSEGEQMFHFLDRLTEQYDDLIEQSEAMDSLPQHFKSNSRVTFYDSTKNPTDISQYNQSPYA